MSAESEEKYFIWLCAKIIDPLNVSHSYLELFRLMHSFEFVWTVPGDENRVGDVHDLRLEYLNQMRLPHGYFEAHQHEVGVSVFEILISFIKRAAFQTGLSERSWFYIFIDNLGLTEEYDAGGINYDRVDTILYNFVWRTYKPNGQGGLFPLSVPCEDQRHVELWYQFFEYIESELSERW